MNDKDTPRCPMDPTKPMGWRRRQRRGLGRKQEPEGLVKEAEEKNIIEFEFEDIGVDHSQYFSGRGTANTDWDEVFIGIGNSQKEAYSDAADQASQAYEFLPETDKLVDKDIKQASDESFVYSQNVVGKVEGEEEKKLVDWEFSEGDIKLKAGKSGIEWDAESGDVNAWGYGATPSEAIEDALNQIDDQGIDVDGARKDLYKESANLDDTETYYYAALYAKLG